MKTLTKIEVAELCNATPEKVTEWIEQGHLKEDESGEVSREVLLEFLQQNSPAAQDGLVDWGKPAP